MNDRLKFKAVLKTSEFTILVKPYYILEDSYFIDINQAETEFENKYPEECFWDFIDEIKKQDYIQEITSDSDLIITKDFTNLIQCTGLKDKNGKLIYECDIVKVDKNTYADSCLLEQFENENAMITYREELGRYNIEFMPKDNSGSNVMDLMADFYYFLKWEPCGKLEYGILEYIEVIGNIYQDSHLIEN